MITLMQNLARAKGRCPNYLEDYRGQDIEAEMQKIQQLLNEDDEGRLSCG
jgi:hypothetical protein